MRGHGLKAGFLTAFFFTCLFFLCAANASAHKVIVFAWVEGDTVYTESKFNGGKKVKGGQITVTDLQGSPLLTGQTDDQGKFSFRLPQKTAMKVELIAGMGHRVVRLRSGRIVEQVTNERPLRPEEIQW